MRWKMCEGVLHCALKALFSLFITTKQEWRLHIHPLSIEYLQKSSVRDLKNHQLSVIVKPKKREKDAFSNLAGLQYSYNTLAVLHSSLFLLSGGFERGRKGKGGVGRGNPLLRQTLSAVPNTETDRGEKEITSTWQTRC